MKNCKFVAAAMLLSLSAPGAGAAECRDERLTRAIERVAGRMPNPVECNLAIYRLPPDHPQFDAAVKDGLIVLKKVFMDGRPATQKLWRHQDLDKQVQK
jgi:hypothetical protein